MHRATVFATASILAAAFSITMLVHSGPAFPEAKEKLTKKAWVGCSGKYEKKGSRMQMDEQRNYVCPKGQKALTRHEAYNACRDQMGPWSFMVVKSSKGWFCRYFAP